MSWQHISFEDGSNPYICKTESEFNQMKKKYELKQIKENLWIAKSKEPINPCLYSLF